MYYYYIMIVDLRGTERVQMMVSGMHVLGGPKILKKVVQAPFSETCSGGVPARAFLWLFGPVGNGSPQAMARHGLLFVPLVSWLLMLVAAPHLLNATTTSTTGRSLSLSPTHMLTPNPTESLLGRINIRKKNRKVS